MAVLEFQELIDWCADESASPRRRHVAGALVYHYRGERALGAWNGFLTCTGEPRTGIDARFEGSLPRDRERDGRAGAARPRDQRGG